MENAESIPVAGVKDWMKNQLKNILLSYAKPYWTDLKTAWQNKDFAKLADVVVNISTLAGYAAVGTAIADVLRSVATGDYLTAIEKAISAVRTILALFPPAPAPKPADSGGVITVSASADPVEREIHDAVEAAFASAPALLTATADDVQLDADGKPVQFGFMEIAAIVSICYTVGQWIRQRRQDKQNQAA